MGILNEIHEEKEKRLDEVKEEIKMWSELYEESSSFGKIRKLMEIGDFIDKQCEKLMSK